MEYNRNIAKIVLGDEDYNGLSDFFAGVLNRPHQFKVAMARRCFNMSYMFMEDKCAVGSAEIITDNALLLYAYDFVEHYVKHGRFPSLLLIDDILLYGRSIYNALYRMENAIFDTFELRGEHRGRNRIHQEMLYATDIMIYAMGDVNETIDSAYLYKTQFVCYRYGYKMLQLSRNISRLYSYCGAANTSHTLSTRIDSEQLDYIQSGDSWSSFEWAYKAKRNKAFFCSDASKVIRAVQVFNQGVSGEGQLWATGFPCAKSVSRESLDKSCKNLVEYVCREGRLAKLLSSSVAEHASYKMSLLSFLDSVETLHHFVRMLGMKWEDISKISDFNRIVRDFGKMLDVQEDLDALCIKLWDESDEVVDLLDILHEEDSKIVFKNYNIKNEEIENINSKGENCLCRIGMESEVDAYSYSHNIKQFTPLEEKHGKISIESFLDYMNGECRDTDVRAFIACEMSLARYGVNSVKYELIETSQEVVCFLKAGELSTHTFPQRHRCVIPALVRIETFARVNSETPVVLLGQFIKYLERDLESGMFEWTNFNDFLQNFQWYIGMTYYCNRSMSRWNKICWGDYDMSTDNSTLLSEHMRLSEQLCKRANAFLKAYSSRSSV